MARRALTIAQIDEQAILVRTESQHGEILNGERTGDCVDRGPLRLVESGKDSGTDTLAQARRAGGIRGLARRNNPSATLWGVGGERGVGDTERHGDAAQRRNRAGGKLAIEHGVKALRGGSAPASQTLGANGPSPRITQRKSKAHGGRVGAVDSHEAIQIDRTRIGYELVERPGTIRITLRRRRLTSLKSKAPGIGAGLQIGHIRRRPAPLAFAEIAANDTQRVNAELHAGVEKRRQPRTNLTGKESTESRVAQTESTSQSEAASNRRIRRALERVLKKT